MSAYWEKLPIMSLSPQKVNLHRDLKILTIELKNQLFVKNVIINYLTAQLFPKSQDKTICICSHITTIKLRLIKIKISKSNLKKKIH